MGINIIIAIIVIIGIIVVIVIIGSSSHHKVGRVVAAVGMAVGVVIGVAVTRVLQVFGICHNSCDTSIVTEYILLRRIQLTGFFSARLPM